MPDKIVDVNVLKQYSDDYRLYALYVCRERVAVDYRDGLTPVQRKIVYAMFCMGDKIRYPKTVKSAKIVGDVMGAYHPHGDSSIYGAMKPISNDFEINIPLLNNYQGSWGNKYGDEAAAMRYTESGFSKFAQEFIIRDLIETENCVDWIDNFDSTTKMPEYLPVALPMALINGSFGIAVGFKVEIPQFNLGEVIDATIRLIRDRKSPVVLIPDTCMPCEIVDNDWESISNLGIGTYTVRGIIDIGRFEGDSVLFIKSAPDMTYYASIKAQIEKMIVSKKIIGITKIMQHDDMLLIKLKSGTDPEYTKSMIYQYTRMQDTARVNFEVLDNMVPMRMSFKSYLISWIEHRKFVKFRVYCNRVQDLNTRKHTIEPFVKLAKSKDMDQIIAMIRKRSLPENELMEMLIKKLDITDIQAKFILNIRLKELSPSFFQKYVDEYNVLVEKIANQMAYLTDDKLIEEDIVEELLRCKKMYNKPRMAKVVSKAEAEGVVAGEFRMIFTQNNFIKKLPMNENIPSFKNDAAKFIVTGENTENLVVFTETGRLFKLPISKIPFSDKRSNGIDIKLLMKNCISNVNAVIYEPIIKGFIKKLHKYYLVTLTRAGYIKKMDLDDFISGNYSGLIYAKLDPDDYVKDVMIIRHDVDVVVYSANKACRFSMDDVPYLKRSTKGNKTMSTLVDGLSLITSDTTDIIVVTGKGFVNRFIPSSLARTSRTGRSSKVIKLSKGDEIIGVYGLRSIDNIVISSTSGRLEIPVQDIPMGNSIGPGTKMLPNRGDSVLSCGFTVTNDQG